MAIDAYCDAYLWSDDWKCTTARLRCRAAVDFFFLMQPKLILGCLFCLLGWSNLSMLKLFSPLPSASSHGIHDDGAANSDVHPAHGEASQPLWQQPRCSGTKYSHPTLSDYCLSLVWNRGLKWNEREKSLVDCGASAASPFMQTCVCTSVTCCMLRSRDRLCQRPHDQIRISQALCD